MPPGPAEGRPVWAERYALICRRYPELIAVYESPPRRLGLLLRETIVPLPEERGEWLYRTRRTVRAVVVSLRAAGVHDEFLVLQWRPLREVAQILHEWACPYDAEPARRAELTRVVDRYLADSQFVRSRCSRSPAGGNPFVVAPLGHARSK